MIGIATLSLRETFRAFTRQKSTFGVAVLTLALGIGVCTAMFCVLYGVILRPLSYGDPKRLVMAWAGYDGGATERDTFGEQALIEWRQRSRAFDGVAGFRFTTFTVLQRGDPTSVEGAVVSPDLFSVLTIRPEAGTAFDPAMAQSSGGKVALISDKLWRQHFGADPDVAGKPINLGGEIYTITGVIPADFDIPTQKTAVWVPLPPPSANGAARARTLYLVGRLRPSVDLAQAQADADLVARHLATAYPDAHRGMRIHLVPFFDELVKDSRQLVSVASVAAFLTLLICCANVSNLLLVRAIVRRSEFATRLAIGAARRHLLAVVFSEGVLLALFGGIIGAVLTRWLLEVLMRLSPVELPRAAAVGAGLQVPLIAAMLSLVAAILVSLPAAWEVGRAKLGVTAPIGARSTSRRFAKQLIVAIEVAIALTLVAGSSLMAFTILALRDANPGWKSDHLLVATVVLPRKTYREPHQIQQFFETFIERLRATPGVVSVSASSSVPATPIGADVDLPIQVPGRSTDNTGQAGLRIVMPGLFKTLGIPVLQGRDFDEGDGNPNFHRLVVNQSFAKKYLPNSPSVLGQQVVVFLGAPQTYEIVGMVGDVHHYGILQDPKPEFYIPFASRPFFGMGVVVRTTGDPAAFAPVFRKELWALNPELPVASAETMEDTVRATWNDRNMLTMLMVSFSAVVVVLTIIGVFSVVRFSVSRQVREIAIHMAVGAQGGDVVRMVMRQSAAPVVAGVALGLTGAWMLGRGLAGLMYGVSASDPRVLVAAAAGVVAIAGIAAYLPSRRAAKLDPVVALRLE
jgi:putative ABC transport system permease protein